MACYCLDLAADLAATVCVEDCNPGIGNTVNLLETCKVTTIPDVDAGTNTISDDLTLVALASFWAVTRFDRKTNGKITGAKADGANTHTWNFEIFIPYLEDTSMQFVKTITAPGYEAVSLVPDECGNTLLYPNTTFSYTYDSLTVNDDGIPGWVLTGTNKGRIPKLYTGAIA